MSSDERIVYMNDKLEHILSPKSPVLAEAVFGSAPRPRRPSTPKSPPSTLPNATQAQTTTPAKKDKALPPIPGPTSPRSPPSAAAAMSNERSRGAPSKRADSPDVETMIARTPRPRRKPSATFHSPILRAKSNPAMVVPSSWKGLKSKDRVVAGDDESVISDYGTLLKDDDSDLERQLEGEGSESDSSIDIHTPLPHLMFRDGLLSPRSKLLSTGTATLSLYLDDSAEGQRASSVLSVASSSASTMTKSGVHRDPRDTERRRNRHRDQTLLRAGMGLTTGLGWSDSEDEDAPSLLTRRLISTSLARQPTITSTPSRVTSQLTKSVSVGSLSHPPPSYSPAPRDGARALSRSTSVSFSSDRLSAAESESVMFIENEPVTRGRTQSNASASSVVSSASRDSSGPTQSVASSSQTSQGRSSVPRPLRLPQTAGIQPSISRSTSVSESRPPVAGASRLAGPRPHTRTRTLSNSSRAPASSVLPRSTASKIVPPRSVSAAVMAPIRTRSVSSIGAGPGADERGSPMNDGRTIYDFPLPPKQTSGSSSPSSFSSPSPSARTLARPSPSVNTQISRSGTASPITPPSATRVLNTVGTGPRPRIGTGMVYRASGYSSFYEASRLSRASVASSSKEVGVI
ncbi:hypothetical protein BD414DRAFT_165415 [Trametes punicea]|nr:hypothetical protein BD414DRAFT_165415 [Trametes punicea]